MTLSHTAPHSSSVRIDFSVNEPDQVYDYLLGLDQAFELPRQRRVTVAGEGNMNIVLRVALADRDIILKQSRPFVAKYPHIPAPLERIHQEFAFYQLAGAYPGLRDTIPQLIHFDPAQSLILQEDLGQEGDFSEIYTRSTTFSPGQLERLAAYLRLLHSITLDAAKQRTLSNGTMRALNHEHIFDLPFLSEPIIDLETFTPGLSELRQTVITRPALLRVIQEMGLLYLQYGPQLVHGDFFPGSMLPTRKGLCVIDPEFSYPGHGEFDYAVFLAHLHLAGDSAAAATWTKLLDSAIAVDKLLVNRWAGIEILRRLFGVAQLPGVKNYSLEKKSTLVNLAIHLILG